MFHSCSVTFFVLIVVFQISDIYLLGLYLYFLTKEIMVISCFNTNGTSLLGNECVHMTIKG